MSVGQDHEHEQSSKTPLFLASLALVITLLVIGGVRMSRDALAVVIGVLCGVLAAIPTALILLAVTRRPDDPTPSPSPDTPYTSHQNPPMPPIIIVTPNQQHSPPALPSYPVPYAATPSPQRQFRILGEEEEYSEIPHADTRWW